MPKFCRTGLLKLQEIVFDIFLGVPFQNNRGSISIYESRCCCVPIFYVEGVFTVCSLPSLILTLLQILTSASVTRAWTTQRVWTRSTRSNVTVCLASLEPLVRRVCTETYHKNINDTSTPGRSVFHGKLSLSFDRLCIYIYIYIYLSEFNISMKLSNIQFCHTYLFRNIMFILKFIFDVFCLFYRKMSR